jgi:predicted Zn-dependent peptidase
VTVEEIVKQVRAVTIADVETLTKRLFDAKKLNFALVGPFKKAERFEKLLGV